MGFVNGGGDRQASRTSSCHDEAAAVRNAKELWDFLIFARPHSQNRSRNLEARVLSVLRDARGCLLLKPFISRRTTDAADTKHTIAFCPGFHGSVDSLL